MPSSALIRITNASFYAYHGVASDEQNLGGKFEVDCEIEADLSDAMAHDSLRRTIDYEAVYATIGTIVTSKKYFLIEALANSIARGILEKFLPARSVAVTVRKPHPPVKGVVDNVEVRVRQDRS
jgi:dihydroneopterin aldolase